jgi:hypothetical protein
VRNQSEIDSVKRTLSSLPGASDLKLTQARQPAPAGKVGFMASISVQRVKPEAKRK